MILPPLQTLLTSGAIVCAGAVLQSAVGFGIGLLVIPLLLGTGRSVPAAVAIVLGAGLVQTAVGLYQQRARVPWRESLRMSGLQWLFVPLGVFHLTIVQSAGPAALRRVVGGVLLLILAIITFIRPAPRAQVERGWAVAAAASAGYLAGLLGSGGPPVVLYALARDWSADSVRAFLWSQFLLMIPPVLGVLTYQFGQQVLWDFAFGVALAPATYLGTRLGLALSRHIDRSALRQSALILLYVIALSTFAFA